jgi:hypothetical protein
VISIDWLPGEALLGIFDYICTGEYQQRREERRKKKEIEAWLPLVHVSRRWRTVVFGSPRRLNLRIFCSHKTRAQYMLDVWPTLPLIICDTPLQYVSPYNPIWDSKRLPNIIALMKHSDRVCRIDLRGVPNPHLEEVSAAMQAPFPELTYLMLWSNEETPTEPVLSDSFLGGSAPRLESLRLYRIPFPGLPKLLLSATHLANLILNDIPHSGYIPPEVMVTALSALTGLRSLVLEFLSPRSCPDRETRHPPPLTRSVFPALTSIKFEGVSEYLDDLVASIDAPQLNSLNITFFNQIVFDTPQIAQFINRTPALKSLDKARVQFGDRATEVNFSSLTSVHGKLNVKVLCGDLDWQVSSMEQVCTSCLPFISTIEVLCIHKNPHASREDWPDNIENRLWLELLHPFTTVKTLYISREFVPRIVPALQELVGGRTTEVLPTLQNLFLERREPSVLVQEGIRQFTATRQVASHPVAVTPWGGDPRWFDCGGDEWRWFNSV